MSSVEDLEARVTHLEDLEAQRRDVTLDSRVQGTAHGLGLVHPDTQAIRAEMATRRDVDELRADLNRRLDDLDRGVTEILSRLPEQR